jgi:HlyD family secretion protein
MVLLILFLMLTANNFSLIIPTLSMFAMASYKLIPSFQQIYFQLSAIKFSQSALDSISNDLSTHLNNNKFKNDIFHSTDSYEIALTNVNFQYPNKEHKVTNDVTLSILENQMIGFVGPSGSGKSTLIDIFLGLLIPKSGSLKIGNIIIDEQNSSILQKLIGYVPQNIFLSDSSIRNNIAFGLDQEMIEESKIISACKQSQLAQFINTLPDGLDTIVGEKGVQLSGGQKQRIAIARALYRNPKILVLDEATSSLDGITEKKIMESISEIASNMTVLVIAHRLNTVKACDMIYYMDDGKIIDNGTYEELMISNQNFKDLSKIS